jgi:hypothetical protein
MNKWTMLPSLKYQALAVHWKPTVAATSPYGTENSLRKIVWWVQQLQWNDTATGSSAPRSRQHWRQLIWLVKPPTTYFFGWFGVPPIGSWWLLNAPHRQQVAAEFMPWSTRQCWAGVSLKILIACGRVRWKNNSPRLNSRTIHPLRVKQLLTTHFVLGGGGGSQQ